MGKKGVKQADNIKDTTAKTLQLLVVIPVQLTKSNQPLDLKKEEKDENGREILLFSTKQEGSFLFSSRWRKYGEMQPHLAKCFLILRTSLTTK